MSALPHESSPDCTCTQDAVGHGCPEHDPDRTWYVNLRAISAGVSAEQPTPHPSTIGVDDIEEPIDFKAGLEAYPRGYAKDRSVAGPGVEAAHNSGEQPAPDERTQVLMDAIGHVVAGTFTEGRNDRHVSEIQRAVARVIGPVLGVRDRQLAELRTALETALAELTGVAEPEEKYERQCFDAAVRVLSDALAAVGEPDPKENPR